jgi:hypothetical protein
MRRFYGDNQVHHMRGSHEHMQRELKRPEEIQAELQRLIDAALDHEGRIKVGLPERLVTVDRSGCNWYTGYFSNAREHLGGVAAALIAVKAKWNLAP